MKKIIWQNLLKKAKASMAQPNHPHLDLLETFLNQANIHARKDESNIGFDEFEQFSLYQHVSKSDLFAGPLGKTFRALDEELAEQTLSFVVDNHTIIYHFKDKLCTDIYNIEIDLESYTYVSTLGEGTNGTARLYRNEDGREIVVKTPNPKIPHSGYYQGRKRDVEISQLLYPDDGFYCVNEHQRSVLNDKGEIVPAFGFYVIAPYIPSESMKDFCKKITTPLELIETLLALTLELHRLHAAGVIHGDIHQDNIRIWRDPKTNKIGIRFIDFEWSYYRYIEKAKKTTSRAAHWAPERIDVSTAESNEFLGESFEFPTLDSHPAQDMFSFGYTLWDVLHRNPLLRELNFIAKFYKECGLPDKDRPLAERFIYELQRQATLEKTAVTSSTADMFKQGIAGKDRYICEQYFTPKDEEKSQDETPVRLANPNFSILARRNSVPPYTPPAKPESRLLPSLIDLGSKASSVIQYMSGYRK